MKIFIVEDDPWYNKLLKHHLSLNPDYDVIAFDSARACIEKLPDKPDLICIDFALPDMLGDALLNKIKLYNSATPVIVISGQDEIGVAINLLKAGASDYIVKDDNTKQMLWNAVHKIGENLQLKKEVESLQNKLEKQYSFEKPIIGQSDAIKKIFKLIEKAVKTNINICISGETGTGKELVANAIHYSSDRKNKPFIAVNMASIPNELAESELFGHEKGAFTGANNRRIGRFEEAQNGTLFLDEIAEMDINLQSKILRALQEREIKRIGGSDVIKIDFRLITATHKDLVKEVEIGNFREDLYYRIMGLPIELPPLRARAIDILMLAKHFIKRFVKENKLQDLSLSEDAKNKLLSHGFPGNIRELKAIVELACVMSDNEMIEANHINFKQTTIQANSQDYWLTEKTLKEFNADIINQFMKHYDGNVLLVAEKLGIGKSTIYNMIKSGEVFV